MEKGGGAISNINVPTLCRKRSYLGHVRTGFIVGGSSPFGW